MNESDIDDVFQSIYTKIISDIQKSLKSTKFQHKFHYLVLMTKYKFKTVDMMD